MRSRLLLLTCLLFGCGTTTTSDTSRHQYPGDSVVHFGDAALLGSMALDQTVGDLPSNTLFLDASNDEARFHLNASGLLTKFGRDLTLTYDGRSTNAFVSDGASGMTLYRRSPQGGDDPASSTFYWASAFELSVTREASGNVHHLVATLVPLSAYDVETRVVDETQALTLTSDGPISLGCSSVSNGAVTLLRSDDPLCAPALP